jgi:hypothetical protein
MTTVNARNYLLFRAKRRLVPTVNNIAGMGLVEKRLMAHQWEQRVLADPPAGSGLKPVRGDSGLPILGHSIESLRQGPDYALFTYQTRGPVTFADSPILRAVAALGPDATRVVFSNKNKDYSQKGWHPVIGPFGMPIVLRPLG